MGPLPAGWREAGGIRPRVTRVLMRPYRRGAPPPPPPEKQEWAAKKVGGGGAGGGARQGKVNPAPHRHCITLKGTANPVGAGLPAIGPGKVKLLPPPHCPGNIDPLGQYLVVEEQLRRALLRRHDLITHRQHR